MNEPQFTRHPTEIFGYPFINKDSVAQEAREKQFCPFLKDEGVRKILGGAHEDKFLTISEFENNIDKRLNVQTRLSGI